MEPLVAILIAVAALVLGLFLGWVFASRQAAPYKAECDTLRSRCSEAEKSQAVSAKAAEVADALRITLDGVREERDRLDREAAGLRPVAERVQQLDHDLATLRAEKDRLAEAKASFERGESERAQAYETQLAQLREIQIQLEARFGDLAAKAVEGAHDNFLKKASERFGHAERQNEEQLKALLQPVEASLKLHKEAIERVEASRVENYGALSGLIDAMRVGQESVRIEASKIVSALRAAPKMKGRWAEQQFKNLIEIAGLSQHVDFEEEVSVAAEGGLLRPDFVIRMPGDKRLIVDIKCSIDAYLSGIEQDSVEERARFFGEHAKAIRAHADRLAEKAYWQQFDEAPDFVIMYVHGDNFISAALESDLGLWERAARNRVIICGPSTFLPMARTIASVWKQERLVKDHRQIVNLGRLMHDRLAGAAESIRLVGSALKNAVKHYNSLVGTYDTAIAREGRRFKELNIDSTKSIEELEEIEGFVRDPRLITADLKLDDDGAEEAAEREAAE